MEIGEEEMSEKCPKCGADQTKDRFDGATIWECGSLREIGQIYPARTWGCMERQLAAVTKERDELREIVDKLPKTADGVPQIPMISCPWLIHYCPKLHFQQCFAWEIFWDAPQGVWHVSGDVLHRQWTPVSCAYSTREAAETAKENHP